MYEISLKRERKSEKIIIHTEEMEKIHNGTIKFHYFKNEFPEHIEKILEERIKEYNRNNENISVSLLMKKIEILTKIAEKNKSTKKKLRFSANFDLIKV